MRTWGYNIKTGLKDIGRDGVDFIHVAQDRNQQRTPVNMVMNLRVPQRGIYEQRSTF
jgi:hypothetical protein